MSPRISLGKPSNGIVDRSPRKGVPVPRDEKGRVLKGYTPNPYGAPGKLHVQILAEEVTPDVLRQIIRRCIQDAINGDRFARAQILAYAWGKPREYKVIEGAAGGNVVIEFRWVDGPHQPPNAIPAPTQPNDPLILDAVAAVLDEDKPHDDLTNDDPDLADKPDED